MKQEKFVFSDLNIGDEPLTTGEDNPDTVSIKELVWSLKSAFRVADFAKVEDALMRRESKIRHMIEIKRNEIIKILKEKNLLEEQNKNEMLERNRVVDELRKCKSAYLELKQLNPVKIEGTKSRTVGELEAKSTELEAKSRTINELEAKIIQLETKSRIADELKAKNIELEARTKTFDKLEAKIVELEAKGRMVDELKAKNIKLEARNRTADELEIKFVELENQKLNAEAELENWKKKFQELENTVSRLHEKFDTLNSAERLTYKKDNASDCKVQIRDKAQPVKVGEMNKNQFSELNDRLNHVDQKDGSKNVKNLGGKRQIADDVIDVTDTDSNGTDGGSHTKSRSHRETATSYSCGPGSDFKRNQASGSSPEVPFDCTGYTKSNDTKMQSKHPIMGLRGFAASDSDYVACHSESVTSSSSSHSDDDVDFQFDLSSFRRST